MSKYRFSGRIAHFFRSTDNAWATLAEVTEGVKAKRRVIVNNELRLLRDAGNVEQRGKPFAYEYRWNPDTLHETTDKRREVSA